MGSAAVHPEKEFPQRTGGDFFDVEDDNGFVFNGILMDYQVVPMILSHLEPRDTLHCRLVCKYWCNIIDSEVFKLKIKALHCKRYDKIRTLPWHIIYNILNNILERNFIKNPCGEEGLKHWEITADGGDRLIVERNPDNMEGEIPFASCFTTSYYASTTDQLIDLRKEGVAPQFLDECQPDIVVSEWYGGRWDCRAEYKLEVHLLRQDSSIIDVFETRRTCGGDDGNDWRQVKHTFRNYGPGVRFIRFSHSGCDLQFWAGHYGSKMTGASVHLELS